MALEPILGGGLEISVTDTYFAVSHAAANDGALAVVAGRIRVRPVRNNREQFVFTTTVTLDAQL